jgi:ubiquinone biosynthesis protein UbiJ
MITDDRELAATQERIVWFQAQLAHLRRAEANPHNYRAAAAGFLAEVDRMQREVREYLSLHPTELAAA